MKKKNLKNIAKRHLKGWAFIFVFIGLILGLTTGYFLMRAQYNKESHETKITLLGDSVMNISLDSEFIDPGYVFIIDGFDYSKDVLKTNDVDTSKEGTYYIEYSLKLEGNLYKILRVVNVLGGSINGEE